MLNYLYWLTEWRTDGQVMWSTRQPTCSPSVWVTYKAQRFSIWSQTWRKVREVQSITQFEIYHDKNNNHINFNNRFCDSTVPQRLINTQCGSDYSAVGSTNSFIDYVQPSTTVTYKMHPNYFFSRDSDYTARIKVILLKFSRSLNRYSPFAQLNIKNEYVFQIEGSGWGELKVCTARQFINVNSLADASVSCTTINSNVHSVPFSCTGADYIHLCPPMYLSISANTSINNYQCIGKCRKDL